MKSRDAEIDRRLQAEAQRKNEITKEQEELAASEAGTRKLLEDYAADCYKYSTCSNFRINMTLPLIT